jgi:hypothetical protein
MDKQQQRPWGPDIDPATIPDEVIKTERGRRNAAKRKTYSGGVYWAEHNPDVPGCRCVACIRRRKKERS